MRRVKVGERVRVTCWVNGKQQSGFTEARTLLTDFLRHELHLYGTHVGCEHGVCGACTIILDGRLARSCSTLALQAEGAQIVTIEGLASDERFDGLRDAFSRHGALQCGFCTPGFLMSLVNYFERTPSPDLSEDNIRSVLAGNLCRCTGYQNIVAAVRRAAELLNAEEAKS